ncbi:MFS-type transporter SLC18B1 [Stylophora pistillata]|uniref:MFS-type transporter SLC18B1 n=1 Tax=Stylophora pistillata TaxID=50429 RepID=A0A2B4S8F8_STYPI|nr:MFS-type transporter SLC18B1 [Stylophora pistillata]
MTSLYRFTVYFVVAGKDRGVSEIYVGLIFGSYAFAIFLTSPPWGVLVPKYGARNVLLTGIFIAATSLMIMGFGEVIFDPTTFVVFCLVLRITSAIGAAAAETAVLACTLQKFPNNSGTISAGMQLSCLCGSSLAPVFGGFLYTVGGFKLPFIIMGLVLLCSIGVLAFLLPSETESRTDDDESKKSIAICNFMRPLKIPAIFMMGFTTVIGCVLYSFMQPILAPHLRSLGQNAAQIGLAFFLFAGVNIISALVLGFITDKMYSSQLMEISGMQLWMTMARKGALFLTNYELSASEEPSIAAVNATASIIATAAATIIITTTSAGAAVAACAAATSTFTATTPAISTATTTAATIASSSATVAASVAITAIAAVAALLPLKRILYFDWLPERALKMVPSHPLVTAYFDLAQGKNCMDQTFVQ